jgi:prepilin-type N-terminal cleavage/methylation domain-containing protein
MTTPTTPTTPRSPARAPAGSRARSCRRVADAGFTLVEYTVAMSIFVVVLSITAGGIAMMARDVVKTTNLSTSTDQMRQAFTRLDRQVRYASQVNFPGKNTAGTSWFVEFLAPDGDGVPTCYQWRLDTAADRLQLRSWPGPPAAEATVAPAWTTVASNVANDPTADQPFTLVPADADTPRQGLDISLVARRASAHTSSVSLETSLYARNSSSQSESNNDADGNGASDTPICDELGRS